MKVKNLLTLVLCFIFVLGGLSLNVQAENTREFEGTEIEFQQWWAVEAPEGYVQGIVDEFYKETGIKVNLLNAPFADTKTQIVSGAATGTVADIVSVDGSWLYDFSQQEILTDMSALMEARGFDRELLNDEWQVEGTTYALPVVNYGYPMFVNMDIMREAGVEEIPENWTWSDFLEISKKVKDAGFYPFALNLDSTSPSGIQNTYMGFAWASDIKMLNDAGQYQLVDNPELVEFAEFMKTVYDEGYLFPGMSSLTEPDMTSNFSSGNLAFVINSMAMLTGYREVAPDMDIQAVQVPVKVGFNGKGGMCVASWAVGITENSENKEAALMFIEYLFGGIDGTDGSVNAGLSVVQSAFPGSSIADPDYADADPVFTDVYGMYQESFPINEFVGMKQANTLMVDFINELIPYMEGDLPVDEYLANVQAAIDEVYKAE